MKKSNRFSAYSQRLAHGSQWRCDCVYIGADSRARFSRNPASGCSDQSAARRKKAGECLFDCGKDIVANFRRMPAFWQAAVRRVRIKTLENNSARKAIAAQISGFGGSQQVTSGDALMRRDLVDLSGQVPAKKHKPQGTQRDRGPYAESELT